MVRPLRTETTFSLRGIVDQLEMGGVPNQAILIKKG